MRSSLKILLLLAAFGGVACSTESGRGGTVTDMDPITADDAGVMNDSAVDPGPSPEPMPPTDGKPVTEGPPIAGFYAIRTTLATIDTTPLGEQNTIGQNFGVAHIEGDYENGFTITERWCHMKLTNDGMLQTSVKDAVPRNIPVRTVAVTMSEVDGEYVLYRPVEPYVLGAELDDPINDALPTDGNDPRVTDMDGDGKPGMTVSISGFVSGDIYAVRREKFDYTVTVDKAGSLHGHTVDNGEQSLVGASNPLLNMSPESRQNPDLSLSPVDLVPMDDDPSCDDYVTRLGSLFPG